MGILHFLNVSDGDCSIIQHMSGRVSVIDVCNANLDTSTESETVLKKLGAAALAAGGNFRQKEYPVNPIAYMRSRRIDSVFRFILTHPDMDHMDGITALFHAFDPLNFWDVDNRCVKNDWSAGRYRKEDWEFYQALRAGRVPNITHLNVFPGYQNYFYNIAPDGSAGDRLYVLAPSPELVARAKAIDDYNDASYVILFWSNAGRILFAGDSHDATWDYILANHRAAVANVDLLIAPHHGRKSGRSYDFLNVVNPMFTLFGNAPSEHLAYSAWNYRYLDYITNNQADCVVIDASGDQMRVFVTNGTFARQRNAKSTYSYAHQAYFLGTIRQRAQYAA